jgi:cytochrome c-type biogenesis protein
MHSAMLWCGLFGRVEFAGPQPSVLLGYGYLVLHNLVFVLPLVVILVAASAHPTLNRLAHWNLHHKEWVRLALGGGVVVMGLLILATV